MAGAGQGLRHSDLNGQRARLLLGERHVLEGPCQAESERLRDQIVQAGPAGQGHPSPRLCRGAAALQVSSGQVCALPAEG